MSQSKLLYAQSGATSQEAVSANALQQVLYAVQVNGQDVGEARFLRDAGGKFYARLEDLKAWRIDTQTIASIDFRGEAFVALEALSGAKTLVDEGQQTIALEFSASVFSATNITEATNTRSEPQKSDWGGFVNYDFLGSRTTGIKHLDGNVEMGVFGPRGVGVSSWLTKNLIGDEARRFVRLDTTWTYDWPNTIRSLYLGDTVSSSGAWGVPVRFGGVRFARNFATRPGFITYAQPTLNGQTALPSTVDLYVDGLLRQSGKVPPGPFQIPELPVIGGQGEVKLVVRDVLGREQIIVQPYVASSALLRAGLTDYSIDAGWQRENFGQESNDYSDFFVSGVWRQGLSDRLTGELRAEALADRQTAGLAGVWAPPFGGILNGAVAISHDNSLGAGGLLQLGYEHSKAGSWNAGVRAQLTSERFTQLGLGKDQRPAQASVSAVLGLPLGDRGTLGLGYTLQRPRGSDQTQLVSASYSTTIAKRFSLTLNGFKNLSGERDFAVTLTLGTNFGENTCVSMSHNFQRGADQTTLQMYRSPPSGEGFGFRSQVMNARPEPRLELGGIWQARTGSYTLDASHAGGETDVRVGASGAVALLDRQAFFARRIDDSFGLVHLPGYAEVPVYVHNRLIGRTNSAGYLVIPRLMSYQENSIRIDPAQLPLDTDIASIEQTLVPYSRSGIAARFAVKRSLGMLVVLLQDSGDPVPVGARVNVNGTSEEFAVAHRGEVYLSGMEDGQLLRVRWRDQRCVAKLTLPKGEEHVHRIGPLRCEQGK